MAHQHDLLVIILSGGPPEHQTENYCLVIVRKCINNLAQAVIKSWRCLVVDLWQRVLVEAVLKQHSFCCLGHVFIVVLHSIWLLLLYLRKLWYALWRNTKKKTTVAKRKALQQEILGAIAFETQLLSIFLVDSHWKYAITVRIPFS